jgi:hypothetical protein
MARFRVRSGSLPFARVHEDLAHLRIERTDANESERPLAFVACSPAALSPIIARNEIKRIFVDGNEVCVFYDLVTETPAGAVASVEWLTIAEDRSDCYRGDAVRRRLLPDTDVGADFGC